MRVFNVPAFTSTAIRAIIAIAVIPRAYCADQKTATSAGSPNDGNIDTPNTVDHSEEVATGDAQPAMHNMIDKSRILGHFSPQSSIGSTGFHSARDFASESSFRSALNGASESSNGWTSDDMNDGNPSGNPSGNFDEGNRFAPLETGPLSKSDDMNDGNPSGNVDEGDLFAPLKTEPLHSHYYNFMAESSSSDEVDDRYSMLRTNWATPMGEPAPDSIFFIYSYEPPMSYFFDKVAGNPYPLEPRRSNLRKCHDTMKCAFGTIKAVLKPTFKSVVPDGTQRELLRTLSGIPVGKRRYIEDLFASFLNRQFRNIATLDHASNLVMLCATTYNALNDFENYGIVIEDDDVGWDPLTYLNAKTVSNNVKWVNFDNLQLIGSSYNCQNTLPETIVLAFHEFLKQKGTMPSITVLREEINRLVVGYLYLARAVGITKIAKARRGGLLGVLVISASSHPQNPPSTIFRKIMFPEINKANKEDPINIRFGQLKFAPPRPYWPSTTPHLVSQPDEAIPMITKCILPQPRFSYLLNLQSIRMAAMEGGTTCLHTPDISEWTGHT